MTDTYDAEKNGRMTERSNTVHGRMLEAAHIAGYTFKRARDELTWLLEADRWKELGFKDGSEFARSVKSTFAEFRISEDERSGLAKQLAGVASQRAIAEMVGVHHSTIQEDLRDGGNPPQQRKDSTESASIEAKDGGNPPTEWFQDDVDPAKLAKGRTARKQRDAEAEARRTEEIRNSVLEGDQKVRADILHGDFRQVLAELRDVQAIITDPPYGQEHLPLLADLGVLADKILAENGIMAVLFGQTHLAEAYRLLDGSRPYRWTMAYLTPGPGYVSHARRVQSQWKPILVYGGGERFADVLNTSAVGTGVEKSNHEWEQDFGGFKELVERLTKPGDTVVDPFAGSGTTLLAAISCGRNAIGAEIDPKHYETASRRLGSDS